MAFVPIRKTIFSVLICLACVPFMAGAAADGFFDTSLGDFAAELKAARQQGKQGVLLVFEAESCPFCRRMREQVLSLAPVQQFFRDHFNSYAIDFVGSVTVTDFTGRELTEKDFARGLRVRGTPTFVFVAVDGKEIVRYTGATRDVAEFMALGRYVVEGHFSRIPFEQFYPGGRSVHRVP